MKLKLLDFLLGTSLVSVRGIFPERVLNIAKEEGILIRSVTGGENCLYFITSRKGASRLLKCALPADLTLSVEKSFGLPSLFLSYRHRLILLLSPIIICLLLFVSTQFIWHVNIIDASPEMEKELLGVLSRHGVKRGAFKHSINQSEIQNLILAEDATLMWIWIDIKGSTAIVKYAERIILPPPFDENEFYNVYSTRDAVITYISASNGVEMVNVGDTVFKGQLLIEGTIASSPDTRRTIHASGEVYGSVWEERVVTIPKKTQIRTPTGSKTEKLSINFTNFRVKLFINSSILYPEYDIIEDNRSFFALPVTFSRTEYREVKVSYKDNDLARMQSDYEKEFHDYLTGQGYTIDYTESEIQDTGDEVQYTMRALCIEPIAQERRMNLGENYSITDN